MAKKRKDRKQKKKRSINRSSAKQFDEAQTLIDDEDYEQAAYVLEKIVAKRPRDVVGWNMLGMVYQELFDLLKMWEVSQKLIELDGKEAYVWLNATSIAMMNNLVFSTFYYADYYLTHFRDDPDAEAMRETKVTVETAIQEILAETPDLAQLPPIDRMELERISMLYAIGQVREGRKVSEVLQARYPNLTAPKNNISLAMALEGDLDAAITLTREVLVQHPDNIHASANLVQYLVRLGQRDEADAIANRLRSLPTTAIDQSIKLMEAFTFLGDYEKVRDIYITLAKGKDIHILPDIALHLAAVAFARTGDEKQARKLWGIVLDSDPTYMIAIENIGNLRMPARERVAAWPFGLSQWVPRTWVEQLDKAARRVRPTDSVKATLKQVMTDIPGLRASLPILFKYGGLQGAQFALTLTTQLELPELVDFATSQDGSESLRIEALNAAAQAGLIPRKQPQRMWIKGEWAELQPLAFDITFELQSDESLPAAINDLIADSHHLLMMGDFDDALAMVEDGLKKIPDNRTLLNYKTAALQALHRDAEAHDVIRYTADLYPDYTFARIGMAEVCLSKRKFDEARTWIQPIMERESLHISEFAALCMIQVKLLMAQGQREGAKSWVDMLEQFDPEHPALPDLQSMVMPSYTALSKVLSKLNTNRLFGQ